MKHLSFMQSNTTQKSMVIDTLNKNEDHKKKMGFSRLKYMHSY